MILPEYVAPHTRPRCGRPTSTGRACKQPRMPMPWPNPSEWTSPSCSRHATAQEHADKLHAFEESERWCAEYQRSLPIRCWEWQVTDDHRRRAREAAEDPYSDRGQQIAWDLLADWQDDRCAICGGRDPRSVLDHDHGTGLVRGWLCHSCNVKEGFASNPHQREARYRTQPPTAILGITLVYTGRFSTPDVVLESLRDAEPLPQDRMDT